MYIYVYIYIYTYIYIYIYIYKFVYVICKCQKVCIKNKTFIYLKVVLRFLPNPQRLNKITESAKSINLKTN